MSSPTPTRLGPYRLLRRIGSGGMAEVFEAERFGASGFVKRVAVKALLPDLADDAELQRLLVAEAKLGARLAHRNLVPVIDLGVDDGRYYLVMAYVDGSDLRRRLAIDTPALSVALFVVDEIAAALEHLHAAVGDDGRALGLVHRDVSPSNVLLSRSGDVVLADFGIAKATHLASRTAARIVRGKLSYLAPEQLAGTGVSARSDQFALGVTLLELMGRVLDAPGMPSIERAEQVEHALAGVPGDVAAVVRRGLAPEPADRFADMTALREALSTLRRGADRWADAAVASRWIAAPDAAPDTTG